MRFTHCITSPSWLVPHRSIVHWSVAEQCWIVAGLFPSSYCAYIRTHRHSDEGVWVKHGDRLNQFHASSVPRTHQLCLCEFRGENIHQHYDWLSRACELSQDKYMLPSHRSKPLHPSRNCLLPNYLPSRRARNNNPTKPTRNTARKHNTVIPTHITRFCSSRHRLHALSGNPEIQQIEWKYFICQPAFSARMPFYVVQVSMSFPNDNTITIQARIKTLKYFIWKSFLYIIIFVNFLLYYSTNQLVLQ